MIIEIKFFKGEEGFVSFPINCTNFKLKDDCLLVFQDNCGTMVKRIYPIKHIEYFTTKDD